MHRIDVASATQENQFSEGNPASGTPATVVSAAWLNDIQENVAEAIEGAGIALSKGNSFQLLDAIKGLISADASQRPKLFGTPGHLIMDNGFVLQWTPFSIAAPAGATQVVVLPRSFPNSPAFVIPIPENSASDQIGYSGMTQSTVTLAKGNLDSTARNGIVIVGGY